MLTPLTESRQVDIEALNRLVNYLITGGVNGIFVLGTSGEGPWLSEAHCRTVVHETVQVVCGRVPVLVGILQPSTPRVLDMLNWVQVSGADAVVVTTPFYYEADAATQEAHIRAVVQASALPAVLYNIPSKTHNPLQLEVMEKVLKEPNIIAFKDSSADFAFFLEALRIGHQRPGFRILQGSERQSLDALHHHADGIVSGLSNLVPGIFVQLLTCVEQGQSAQAEALQAQISALWKLHTHTYWLSALKYAASVLGLCQPTTVGHHTLLDPLARQAIEQIVRENGTDSSRV
jgi:dihydrodipicolinate synthase/N-acetylneuraminate lyase